MAYAREQKIGLWQSPLQWCCVLIFCYLYKYQHTHLRGLKVFSAFSCYYFEHSSVRDKTWLLSFFSWINSFTTMGSGGNEKLPPRSFSTVGIGWEFCQASTQLPPQTSSPWCSVCPPYGVHLMNRPNPTCGQSSEGAGRGHLGGVIYKLILQLLVFSKIRLSKMASKTASIVDGGQP